MICCLLLFLLLESIPGSRSPDYVCLPAAPTEFTRWSLRVMSLSLHGGLYEKKPMGLAGSIGRASQRHCSFHKASGRHFLSSLGTQNS